MQAEKPLLAQSVLAWDSIRFCRSAVEQDCGMHSAMSMLMNRPFFVMVTLRTAPREGHTHTAATGGRQPVEGWPSSPNTPPGAPRRAPPTYVSLHIMPPFTLHTVANWVRLATQLVKPAWILVESKHCGLDARYVAYAAA